MYRPDDCGAPNRCAWCGERDPDKPAWHLRGRNVWLHGWCIGPWYHGPDPEEAEEAEALRELEEAERETGQSAGMPFVISEEMRRRLRLCGYSHERVAQMTPQEAHAILGQFS
jgi:hypothetical protein